MTKKVAILFFVTLLSSAVYSQIGIRAGVNLAGQDFKGLPENVEVTNLTAFQAGIVYQLMPDYLLFKWFGLGLETGAMFSQKGSMFNIKDTEQTGYNELNYIEIPVNIHARFKFGRMGIYAFGGMFASCMINGKTVSDETAGESRKWELDNFDSRFDYGYSVGGGLDVLRKLQIGFCYSQSLENLLPVQYVNTRMQAVNSIHNKMYSIYITFLF
ncbi:PorT family protein [Paludibacteraceae bacterium OttesenSCG-928-F17]|nr:PorT family protein [Paludibacteraceae bacterium OttesenSCG-928-F17]